MKKIECHKITMLDDNQAKQVCGGRMSLSDAANTAIGGDPGCGSGARDARNGSKNKNHSGGCGSGARNNGGTNKGGSRVICTHFFRKNMIDAIIWRADLDYTEKYLSETTIRGYHYWAIPYVELMRKNKLAEKIMFPIAKYRAIELAYQMKVINKGSFRGKLIRLLFEPSCYLIGQFCKQKNWKILWEN